MKLRDALCLAVLGAASLLAAGSALSQDKPAEGGGGMGDADAMARWMETMQKGPHHYRMAKYVGKWNVEAKMMGMGDMPAEKGVAEFSWLFPGGKWLQQRYDGTMMGMPYKGFGIHGYDNYKKKYVGVWIADMTTNMLTFEGNYDGSGKTMLEFGLMDEPMTGEHDKMVQYVTREISDDEFIFEVHDMPIGEGKSKVIEMRYTRVK